MTDTASSLDQVVARRKQKSYGVSAVSTTLVVAALILNIAMSPLYARTTSMLEEPKVPVVMWGFGLPGENQYAPNEKVDVPNYYRGIVAVASWIEILGKMSAIADWAP